MKKIIILITALGALSITSCKKSYFDTKPTDAIDGSSLYEFTSTFYPMLEGVHAGMNTSFNTAWPHAWGINHTNLTNDVMGNDMVCSGSDYDWFNGLYTYQNMRVSLYRDARSNWLYHYKYINAVNSILANIDNAKGPQEEKNDIKAQALTYRAFFYWNLVQFYCESYKGGANGSAKGLPLYTKPFEESGADGVKRSDLKSVYDLMLADMAAATSIYESGVVKAHTNKSQITSGVSYGMYARVLMEVGEYNKAYDYANKAIAGKSLMSQTELKAGFNDRNNPEFMWCSTLTDEQYNSQRFASFVSFMWDEIPSYAREGGAPRKITRDLYNQIPAGDARRDWFKTSLIQKKIRSKGNDNYICDAPFMRVAEMYLIMAEAANEANNVSNARAAMTTLNAARGNTSVIPSDQAALRDYIRINRRIELWGEGFAFKDLKRWNVGLNRPSGSGNHDAGIAVNLTFAPNAPEMLFKIPQSEIDNNKNMTEADQNP